ncbi:transmembrane protein 17 [Trichuris trichiura]|uniref:Transmembrane protein 17 n=1 Tax=Trichuris trichiura TaxID=36087 RepID=A0A077ZFC9_TRITR|nr:transmembrane protein 17 [Trichuris trichiura]
MDAKKGSVVDQTENSDLVLSTTELASSLPLQMAIYFNAYFAPCWLVGHVYTLVQKYELLDVTHRSIVLALHLLMVVVEMVRLYVGFLGNITENVSQLSGFWIATLLLQLPMCLFFTFSGGLISLPLDIGIDVVQVAFLLFELVVGIFAIRKMSRVQYSRFRKDISDTADTKVKGKVE